MSARQFCLLPFRGVIAVAGEDRVEFLQGLISNDVTKVAPTKAIWAALLTPQGRFLNDMFVVDAGFGTLLLETEREEDGRWIAEVPALPGVLAYGATQAEARAKAKALARRVIKARIEHGEPL